MHTKTPTTIGVRRPHPLRHCKAGVAFIAILASLGGCASSNQKPAGVQNPATPQAVVSGSLPERGTVVLRSGMTRMNETTPLFQTLAASVQPKLAARGMTVVSVAPSVMPSPDHTENAPVASGRNAGRNLTLQPYAIPLSDADLPPSVMAVRPVDPAAALHAHSQDMGRPVVYTGMNVPGRLPSEMISSDPAVADYAFVCRFAAVNATGMHLSSLNTAFNPDMLVTAAGPIRGVGTLGYGNSAPSSPPPPPYGGGPNDFSRGREGPINAPPDFFGREADLRARDFQLKYGPQPQYATPPQPVSPGVSYPPNTMPSMPKPPLPGDEGLLQNTPLPPASGGVNPAPSVEPGAAVPTLHQNYTGRNTGNLIAAYVLEMDCYRLDVSGRGSNPLPVWRARVEQPATTGGLEAALPGMVAVALAKAH